MGADTPRQLQQSGRLAILRAYNAPEAPQTAKNDNSGHLCARTKNRHKKATVKPETVKGKYSQSGTETTTATERPQPETVKRSECSTVSTLPETETRAVCGSEPPRKCKPPARPWLNIASHQPGPSEPNFDRAGTSYTGERASLYVYVCETLHRDKSTL